MFHTSCRRLKTPLLAVLALAAASTLSSAESLKTQVLEKSAVTVPNVPALSAASSQSSGGLDQANAEATALYQKVAPTALTLMVYDTAQTNLDQFGSAASTAAATGPTGRLILTGSGFLVDSRGFFATSWEVAGPAVPSHGHKMFAKLSDGSVLPVMLVGGDPERDIGVAIMCRKEPFAASPLLDRLPSVGETVFAMGPQSRFTKNFVTGFYGRILEFEHTPMNCVQLQTPVSAENSGSPLFDANGNILGIETSYLPKNGPSNMGLAIPIAQFQKVFTKLEDQGVLDMALEACKYILDHQK